LPKSDLNCFKNMAYLAGETSRLYLDGYLPVGDGDLLE
jgi:hypothetical protein